jgi:hypothetical protein
MPLLGGTKGFDAAGHPTDPVVLSNAGFTVSTTSGGTTAGTIVNGGTNDPTGTTNITEPWMICDSYGQFQITTGGTQAHTNYLRVINFQKPYPVVRPCLVTVTSTGGVAKGGTITPTMSNTQLSIATQSSLVTSTTYNIAYVIL